MKNQHSGVLVLITCVFAAFTLGFLLGRTSAPGDTIVTKVSQQNRQIAAPAEATDAPIYTASPDEKTVDAAQVPSSPAETTLPAASEPGLININTATFEQLDSLPGIGPVTAQRILDYREQHGPFTNLSQLTLVEGIGEKRLTAIIDLITIE